jgi:hypothetical protein
LCLLAALFAFEAKLAWFSPAGTPCAQISAAKLQPAAAPKLIAEVLAAHNASQHSRAEASALLASALFVALIPQPLAGMGHKGFDPEPSISHSFLPHLFRRPPPKS